MIAPTNWFVAVAPVDLRCGMDRLLLRVQQHYARDCFDGAAYVFRNGTGNRIKVLVVDATGVWLCVRRLHQGGFVWPRADDSLMTLSAEQMAWLLMGVDWQRLSADLASVPKQF